MFNRKSIFYYMLQISSSTLLSRFLGIIRELWQVRYLGVSGLSDAFIIALSIPTSLRKFFAEGALSSALVPVLVHKMKHEGRSSLNQFMTLSCIVFETMVAVLCVIGMYWAPELLRFLVPGFTPEQLVQGALFLRILMPFILFISTSALFGGALQASGHFLIPALGPAILNVMYLLGLALCMAFNLPITALCWFIVLGAVVQCAIHVAAYLYFHFGFAPFSWGDLQGFNKVFLNFIWSVLGKGVNEVGFYVDKWFASFLASGSVTLIYYANRFMNIPLGIFGVAFSTILLPHFSRAHAEKPRRFIFHVTQAVEFILWIMIPITVIMMALSNKIFTTLFLSDHFSVLQAQQASAILQAFLIGLCFFSLNTVLVNVYYALGVPWLPGVIGAIATGVNIVGNMVLIRFYGTVGLALATSISGIAQTSMLFFVLRYFNRALPLQRIGAFVLRYLVQLVVVGAVTVAIYLLVYHLLFMLPAAGQQFLLYKIGFWFWVGPLIGLFFLSLYLSRHYFKIKNWYLN